MCEGGYTGDPWGESGPEEMVLSHRILSFVILAMTSVPEWLLDGTYQCLLLVVALLLCGTQTVQGQVDVRRTPPGEPRVDSVMVPVEMINRARRVAGHPEIQLKSGRDSVVMTYQIPTEAERTLPTEDGQGATRGRSNVEGRIPLPQNQQMSTGAHSESAGLLRSVIERAPALPRIGRASDFAFQEPRAKAAQKGPPLAGLTIDDEASLADQSTLNVPPDPHGAVGQNHICHVVNTAIQCLTKDGSTTVLNQSFPTFFGNDDDFFDPKMVYDHRNDQYIVVVLFRKDDGTASNNVSELYMAATTGSDPSAGNWTKQSFDMSEMIDADDDGSADTECWADFPLLSIDEEAIYVTHNYFAFDSETETGFCDSFLAIFTQDILTGGTSTLEFNDDPNDGFSGGDFDGTVDPAYIPRSTPSGSSPNVGTWVAQYGGLTSTTGPEEFWLVTRVDDPLSATPSFTSNFVDVGDVDDTGTSEPDAPQRGGSDLIETNGRRVLDLVWDDDNTLWGVATVVPPSGDNSGQITAHFAEIDVSTLGSPSLTSIAEMGGEDVETGAHTFFPSVAIDDSDNAVFGFSLSGDDSYAGSYFMTRTASGTLSSTLLAARGKDYYSRDFGGGNRWGDYSDVEIDPSDGSLWTINQVALERETSCSSNCGRWGVFMMNQPLTSFYSARLTGTNGTGDADDKGWRTLASPAADVTRLDLEDDLDFTSIGSGNLIHKWGGGGSGSASNWNGVSSSSGTLPRGEGFIAYLFDDDIDEVTVPGTQFDVPSGSEDLSTDHTVSSLAQSDKYHLLGNPFTEEFDLTELKNSGATFSSSGFQAVVLVRDPAASGSWTTITEGMSSDKVAAWQGFFLERTSTGSGATSLTFNTAGKQGDSGTLVSNKAIGADDEPPNALVDLGVTVTSGADTLAGDRVYVLFIEGAGLGWDIYEASQLPPPQSSSYVTFNSPIERDGNLVRRLQASRGYPTTTDTITVPLSVRSVDVDGTATIRWPDSERSAVPDEWVLELEDTATGERVNLSTDSYDFGISDGDGGSLSASDEARFRLNAVPGSAIPVELAGFGARATGGETVRLTWRTASETNNAGFVVQRKSPEGEDSRGGWTRLGFVDSKAQGGTTSQSNSYRFTDRELPFVADSLIYRLRQLDTDGTVHYSKAITVLRGAPDRLALDPPFPNPATQQVTLRLAVPEQDASQPARISVYDVLGRRVASVGSGGVEAGRHQLRLDVGSWAAGTYFLRLTTDRATRTQKMTVVH